MERKIKGTTIQVIKGDITEQNVDGIVNAANNQLLMGGGVAGAIKKKGGPSIQQECNKLAPINAGEAVTTGAGNLKAKYVIHAATMGMDFETDENRIRSSTLSSLLKAEEKSMISIAFPALGCGVGGFPLEKAAKIMLEEIINHLKKPSSLKNITFVLINDAGVTVFGNAFSEHLDNMLRKTHRNPVPTVDIIIELKEGILLVKRKNPPYGWAIPGGFVEYGETLERTAEREAREETDLKVKNLKQFHTYSDPKRDPRHHTITTVFTAQCEGIPKAGSDAENIKIFNKYKLPSDLAFDHKQILEDYIKKKY